MMSQWRHKRDLSLQDLILTLVAMQLLWAYLLNHLLDFAHFSRQIDIAMQRSHAEIHCHQAKSWAVRECLLISMATAWDFRILFLRGHPLAPIDCSCAILCRSVKNSRRNKQTKKRTENSNYSMITLYGSGLLGTILTKRGTNISNTAESISVHFLICLTLPMKQNMLSVSNEAIR